MKKFNCNNPILLDKFKEHHLYKDKLLKYFDEYNLAKNNFGSDNITKFDWHISTDFNREWVKMIYDDLHKHFLKYANHLGFKKCNINNLWFQQYDKNSTHQWHIHGDNYTGVYYVNFNKDCAKTRLLNTNIKSHYIDIQAEEGDIVFFPSVVIHRALVQNTNFLKTIISFNVNFDDVIPEVHNSVEKNIIILK